MVCGNCERRSIPLILQHFSKILVRFGDKKHSHPAHNRSRYRVGFTSNSRGTHSRHSRQAKNVSRKLITRDIDETLYSCSGLTSHTVHEELSATCRVARGSYRSLRGRPSKASYTHYENRLSLGRQTMKFRPKSLAAHNPRIWDVHTTHSVFSSRAVCVRCVLRKVHCSYVYFRRISLA